MQVQAELALGEYATEEQIQGVRKLTEELYKAQEAAKLNDLLGQYDKGFKAQSDFDQKMADLNALLEAQKISEDQYREYTLNAERELKERLQALDEERFRNQSEMNSALLDAMNNFASSAGSAFGSVITNTTSARDAVHNLAKSLAGDLIGSMVKVGAQMAMNAVKEKLFAAQSAATAATTGAAITAAYTPAAAAASVASFGGAATAGMTAMAAAIPAMLSMFGGGREHGGPVDPSKFYRVNEGGKPELLNVGNKQYLMPNQRGEVVSNADATAGGGSGGVSVIVNLHESAERAGQVEQSGTDTSVVIDAWVADLLGDGQTARAMESKYGLNGVGR